MSKNIGEKGVIVYPVYSRRAGGLSIGINLFPDKKICQFDCPYCEVFGFLTDAVFSLEQMERDLRDAVELAQKQNIEIKDICFSGRGEPTLSCAFGEALKLAENIRAQMTAMTELVVITNGTGLLQPHVFSILKDAAAGSFAAMPNPSLNIWLKLDAGTQDWYKKINRSEISHEKLIEKIKEFTSFAPVTIQTMLCEVDGNKPSETEANVWETLVCQLAANKPPAGVRKVQIYGKSRCAPEDPLASALPASFLEKRAASLQQAFEKKGITTPVKIYL